MIGRAETDIMLRGQPVVCSHLIPEFIHNRINSTPLPTVYFTACLPVYCCTLSVWPMLLSVQVVSGLRITYNNINVYQAYFKRINSESITFFSFFFLFFFFIFIFHIFPTEKRKPLAALRENMKMKILETRIQVNRI